MHTGSCYCGDIHYQIEGDILRLTSCRCDTCSRTIDAHVDWVTVQRDTIVLVSGTPKRRTVDAVTRTFCGRCGTLLTYRDESREEMDVTVSSLHEGGRLACSHVSKVDGRHIYEFRAQSSERSSP